jgi:hypothetical protein
VTTVRFLASCPVTKTVFDLQSRVPADFCDKYLRQRQQTLSVPMTSLAGVRFESRD